MPSNELTAIDLLHIEVAGDAGEAPRQDALAGEILLDLPGDVVAAGLIEAEFEAADPGEQGADPERHLSSSELSAALMSPHTPRPRYQPSMRR